MTLAAFASSRMVCLMPGEVWQEKVIGQACGTGIIRRCLQEPISRERGRRLLVGTSYTGVLVLLLSVGRGAPGIEGA